MKAPVLIIDDEPEILAALRRLLRREFEVFTASSGAEGLVVMERQEVHVILTDQRMPNVTGVELLSRTKTEYPDAIRVLFTGHADVDSVIQAVNSGQIHRYLVKPWNTDELLVTVREASEHYALVVSRRRLTEELQRANAELDQRVAQQTDQLLAANHRLEALSELKDEFLAIVSHDLRTPLTGILGAVDLLKSDFAANEAERDDLLAMIRRSGQRMLNMVNNLLDLARIEAGQVTLDLHPIALPPLLRECMASLSPVAQAKSIACELDCAPDVPDVAADSAKLYQVFSNLMGNAIKFTGTGGKMTVRCVWGAESGVQVSVEDSGRGILPEDMPRLFTKFEQTRVQATRGERGSGLGLYIVKQLVELHGGSVSVKSVVGVGSAFTVSFPTTLAVGLPDAARTGTQRGRSGR